MSEEKVALLRQRDIELQKNRELSAILFDLEGKNRNRDDQLIILRKEVDDVKFSNSSSLFKSLFCNSKTLMCC